MSDSHQGLVSVIVPSYNRAYCLPQAIDSALAQTYPSMEVLIIDDGSTDGTEQLIATQYAAECAAERIRYFYQQNQGVSSARNRGISAARGEYIAFLDSDDTWEPWKIALQVTCLERYPEIVMVWTDMRARNPEHLIVHERYLRKMYSAYSKFPDSALFASRILLREIAQDMAQTLGTAEFKYGDLYSAMIMGSLVHTSTTLLRRSIAAQVGDFNTEYRAGEDYDYHIRTCKLGPVGLLDIPAVEYQLGYPDRLTRSEMRLLTAQNFLNVLEREIFQDNGRILLPKRMTREVLAEAHEWIGYELLAVNETRQARTHFLKSLQYCPWQPNTARLTLLSCLPQNAFRAAREWYRARKGISPTS